MATKAPKGFRVPGHSISVSTNFIGGKLNFQEIGISLSEYNVYCNFMHSFIAQINKAYGGIHRNIWILAAATFINRCGSMVLLFMSVYLTKELHLSLAKTGFVMSMFGIGSFVGAMIGGRLVDKIGFYPILIWSLFLCGISILVLGQMQHYGMIALLCFLMNASGDAFRPANSASISFYSSKENYTKSIALIRLAMNLGFTIGPVLGGLLASVSYRFVFWTDGLTCICAAVFLFFVLPGNLKKANTASTHNEETELDDETAVAAISPYKNKHYLIFLVSTTLYATAFFQIFSSMPLFFRAEYHLQESQIGLLMACNGIGVAVIEMFLISIIQNKWTQFNFISLGTLLLAISFAILIPWHAMSILILSIVFLTFSEMFAMPFMSTYAITTSPKKYIGQYMALYSVSWSVAQTIAPLIGTALIALGGYKSLWMGLILLTTLPFLGFQWLHRNTEKSRV